MKENKEKARRGGGQDRIERLPKGERRGNTIIKRGRKNTKNKKKENERRIYKK